MISRSVSIQFREGATKEDIARFMHKLNAALANIVHGKILSYDPPRTTNRLILECPIEAEELAEAVDLVPSDVRQSVERIDIFEELLEENREERRATGS